MNLDRLAAKINSVGIEINVGQLEKITGEERLKQFYTQIVERLIGKMKLKSFILEFQTKKIKMLYASSIQIWIMCRQ